MPVATTGYGAAHEGDPFFSDPGRQDIGDPPGGLGYGISHLDSTVADVDGNGSPTRVEDITPIGEVERAPFGTLHHRWEVVRRHEREGSDSLLVDHWSLAGRTSQTLRHNPEVPLECN